MKLRGVAGGFLEMPVVFFFSKKNNFSRVRNSKKKDYRLHGIKQQL